MKYIFAVLMLLSSLSNASTTWQAVLSETNNTSTNGSGSAAFPIKEILSSIQSGTGELWASGKGDDCSMSNGCITNNLTPLKVSTGVPIKNCSYNYNGILCVTNENPSKVIFSGTLGEVKSNTFSDIIPLSDVNNCSNGSVNYVCVLNNGKVYGAGKSNIASNAVPISSPIELFPTQSSAYPFKSCTTDGNDVVCVRGDGTVWGIGNNLYIEFGVQTTAKFTPIQITGFGNNVKKCSNSGGSIICTNNDGTVKVSGGNTCGQLGISANSDTLNCASPQNGNVPTSSPQLSNSDDCNINGGTTICLRKDSSVVAVGYNYYGQLGDGTTTNTYTPKIINDFYGAISCGTGVGNTFCVMPNGTVKILGGFNNYGLFGNGTTTPLTVSSPITLNFNNVTNCTSSLYTIFCFSSTVVQYTKLESSCDGSTSFGTNNGKIYACLAGVWKPLKF
jgi:hypothetical protein